MPHPLLMCLLRHACSAGRARPPRADGLSAAPGELQQQALTRLALQTLGSFDFGPARLLEFCRDHVVSYLDESDVATRRAAALAAAQVRACARSQRAAAAGAG
jgi:FKBP12-rapamycin complex-associated protein